MDIAGQEHHVLDLPLDDVLEQGQARTRVRRPAIAALAMGSIELEQSLRVVLRLSRRDRRTRLLVQPLVDGVGDEYARGHDELRYIAAPGLLVAEPLEEALELAGMVDGIQARPPEQ